MAPQHCDPPRSEKIEEYFSCIDVPFAHEVDWARAIELRKQLLPKSMFKYQSFDTNKSVEPGEETEDFCLQNLRNRRVRLTSPIKFNDPYDSVSFFLAEKAFEKVPFDLEAFLGTPEVRDHMSEERKNELRASDRRPDTIDAILIQDIPDEASRRLALELREKFLKIANEANVWRLNDLFRKMTRVCSLCEINDSIVMWSHYGGFHTGFCIEFDAVQMGSDLEFPQGLHPVRYNVELFDVTRYLAAIGQQRTFGGPIANNWAVTVACHKSPGWAYEKEWRVVALDARDFSPVEPMSLILGARIDDVPKQKAAVLAIAKALQLPIKRAVLRQDRFELTLVDY
jgi:hypothetical protein